MRRWRIPVSWEMCGTVCVEADTLEEAIDRAEYDPDIPIPDNGNYIDGSWSVEIDVDSVREWYNDNAPDDTPDSHPEVETGEVCDSCSEEIDDVEIEPIDISDFLQINP